MEESEGGRERDLWWEVGREGEEEGQGQRGFVGRATTTKQHSSSFSILACSMYFTDRYSTC